MDENKYIAALLMIKSRDDEYRKVNRELLKLQGDYCIYLTICDAKLLTCFVEALDDAFFTLTDIKELASYFLWDAPRNALIKSNGKEYKWTNDEEFKQAVLQMMEDKYV